MKTHLHHIVPKQMGGTDDPDNLVELTVAEHAEAHRVLWEEHGKVEDLWAWKGLSGMMSKEEIITELQSLASTKANRTRVERGEHNFLGDKNPSRRKVKEGTHHFQQDIGNRPADIAQRNLVANGEHNWQTPEHAAEVGLRSKKLIGEGKHPFGKTVTCDHCGVTGQKAAMAKWHGKGKCE